MPPTKNPLHGLIPGRAWNAAFLCALATYLGASRSPGQLPILTTLLAFFGTVVSYLLLVIWHELTRIQPLSTNEETPS